MATPKEDKIYRDMIEKALRDYEGQIEELTFYMEVIELFDKRGNVKSEKSPRLTISFK